MCNKGFEKYEDTCRDRNECRDLSHECNELKCVNTFGGYKCSNQTKAIICATCDRNADCVEIGNGTSWGCQCNLGYEGNGVNCTDRNECETVKCFDKSVCVNFPGSYLCHCEKGYRELGNRCWDIDECQQLPCHQQATCKNTLGSFDCNCKSDTVGSGFDCINGDQCREDLGCGKNSVCTFSREKLQCSCPAGYYWVDSSRKACEDIDECAGKNGCSLFDGAQCVNTPGSYV